MPAITIVERDCSAHIGNHFVPDEQLRGGFIHLRFGEKDIALVEQPEADGQGQHPPVAADERTITVELEAEAG